MKLEMKLGRKKHVFVQTKRCVKIWDVNGEPVMKEWNLDEREPMVTAMNRKLVYYAEFWNVVIEHVNNAKVKADVED